MCTSPLNAQFDRTGKITFSKRNHNSELAPFQVPCGQCTECKLAKARDWSIRCYHESKVHEKNCFITLTYDPENLPPDGKLNHLHFKNFLRRLQRLTNVELSFYMCGEYGEKNGRPHYHACIFGHDFADKKRIRTNHNGDDCYSSETLTNLWGLGHTELGQVTQKSAGYVARYMMKKQKTNDEFPPYQKMSRKFAIGKRFLEKFWSDIFVSGRGSVIMDGQMTKVPRYYEKWLQNKKPDQWRIYMTEVKPENTARLRQKAEKDQQKFLEERNKRKQNKWAYKSPAQRKDLVLKNKVKNLKRSFE